eukprot:3630836-Amphidinium_carterae.1
MPSRPLTAHERSTVGRVLHMVKVKNAPANLLRAVPIVPKGKAKAKAKAKAKSKDDDDDDDDEDDEVIIIEEPVDMAAPPVKTEAPPDMAAPPVRMEAPPDSAATATTAVKMEQGLPAMGSGGPATAAATAAPTTHEVKDLMTRMSVALNAVGADMIEFSRMLNTMASRMG